MSTESHRQHFANEVGKQTLTMLMAYREFGVLSRTFMLKEHRKMLEEIQKKSGEYQQYSERTLLFLESCIYVELIEHLCQLIEDFSTICHALSGDLADFPTKVIIQPNTRNLLRQLNDDSRWFNLLHYPEPDKLLFSMEDKEFLKQHYRRNIDILKNLVASLTKFCDLYWLFYNKHKHANPLIYGLEKKEINDEETLIIPFAYNSRQPDKLKSIPFSYSMYQKAQKIFNTLFMLLNDLLDRTVLFIRRNGVEIIEHVAYYEMTTQDKERLNKLIQLHDSKVEHADIRVNLKLTVESGYLNPFFDFYNNLDLGAFNRQ